MNIKYIDATEEDRGFFVQAHHTAYRDMIEEMFGWDEKLQDEHANRAFDEGGMTITWMDDRRIGVVGWEDRDNYLWLKDLFLLPDYQGNGVGSQIINDTITKARSLAKDVRSSTLKANLRAKKLYEHHGFEVMEATDIHWNMVRPFTVPELQTERLILKPVTLKNVDMYHKHFVDYEIIRNFICVPWPYPDDGVESYLNTLVFPFQGDSQWLWGLFLRDNPSEMIGAVHLWRESEPDNRSFWLSSKHQGKGLMTEAVKTVMDYAFSVLGFKKFIFMQAAGNKKSRRIKEKTGGRFLRTEPMSFVDPEFTEMEVWELCAEEWFNNQR